MGGGSEDKAGQKPCAEHRDPYAQHVGHELRKHMAEKEPAATAAVTTPVLLTRRQGGGSSGGHTIGGIVVSLGPCHSASRPGSSPEASRKTTISPRQLVAALTDLAVMRRFIANTTVT
jgi:hypothetical protein